MLMWIMSDRAIPRSFRTMEGFGVHTFRLVNDEGEAPTSSSTGVPRPACSRSSGTRRSRSAAAIRISIVATCGTRSTRQVSRMGTRRAALRRGVRREVRLRRPRRDQADPGRDPPAARHRQMVLDRNVDNYFAETEQVAFRTSNVVPGIDFTNDPLLQGRISPTSTRRSRASADRTTTRSR